MSEDYIARLMAAKALKNGGGEQVDSYSKTEVDEKLDALKTELQNFINTAGFVKGTGIQNFQAITSEAYEALPEKDSATIYCVQDAQ